VRKATLGHISKIKMKFDAVVHTVGPVWRPSHSDGTEEKLPAGCYHGSLEVADRGHKSIAFPALRTGIYGFLIELAAQIAVAEVAPLGGHLKSIFLVCFQEDTLAI
jgi:O-acetyl-ADP-ribose deacetylase